MSSAAAAVRRLRGVSPKRALGVPGRLFLTVPARTRRRGMALALVLGVGFALYMLVLRDLGVVAVDRVQVTGLTGKDAGRAGAALEQAAQSSTTLHVDHGALDQVTARFPTIHSLRIQTDFPKGMRIQVIEQRPAAMLVVGARRIPVAADGSVLSGLPIKDSLPVVKVQGGSIPAKQLTPSGTLDAVRVAGGAPALLTPRLTRVTRQPAKGWVVEIKDGPDLIFGPAARLGAKWIAATRVLADRDAAGADYIDLRIPDRPAAGGLPVQTVEPVAPADSQDGARATGQADPAAPQAGSSPTATPSTTAPQPAPVQPSTPAPAGAGQAAEP